MNKNLLRQVKDIQSQADNIIRNKNVLENIGFLSQYNKELKLSLQEEVKDKFILKYINEIPELNVSKIQKKGFWPNLVAHVFAGAISGIILGNHVKEKEAQTSIKEIQGKYASIELLLKNYF